MHFSTTLAITGRWLIAKRENCENLISLRNFNILITIVAVLYLSGTVTFCIHMLNICVSHLAIIDLMSFINVIGRLSDPFALSIFSIIILFNISFSVISVINSVDFRKINFERSVASICKIIVNDICTSLKVMFLIFEF